MQMFLKWYTSKNETGPSFTALAESKKPKTAGKKREGVTKKSARKYGLSCLMLMNKIGSTPALLY